MIKLISMSDSQISRIPPPYRPPTLNALKNLPPIDSPDHNDRGFVVFVEQNDRLSDINQACHRGISIALEGAFLDGNCLIGVVLWGNSGDGVTIVCPDIPNYPEEIANVLRKHL